MRPYVLALGALAMALATTALAQNYMKFIESPNRWPKFRAEAKARHEAPRDFEDNVEDFSSTRASLNLESGVFSNGDWGLGLTADGSLTELQNSSGLLPDRLVNAGVGANAFFKLDDKGDFRLMPSLGLRMRSDMEDVELEDVSVDVSVLLQIRLSDKWSLIPGLWYSTRTVNGRLPAIPFPTVEVLFRPAQEFSLLLGFPINGFYWQATDWFRVQAFAIGPFAGSATLTETVGDVSFTQFVRYDSTTYDLTDEAIFNDEDRLSYHLWEAGVGIFWEPTEHIRLGVEYSAQFYYKWEYRNSDGDLFRQRVRPEEGNALTLTASLSW